MNRRYYGEAEIEALVRTMARAEFVTIAKCKRRLIRIKDIIEELGCSRAHVRDLVRRGKLQLVELDTGVGKMRFVTIDSYDAHVNSACPVRMSE